jgi:mediator of RNA polymerase II transcription subunit 14
VFLYIRLAQYPSNYLVLVVGDEDFRYALIAVRPRIEGDGAQTFLAIDDLGWLDVAKITGRRDEVERGGNADDMPMDVDADEVVVLGDKRKRDAVDEQRRDLRAKQHKVGKTM